MENQSFSNSTKKPIDFKSEFLANIQINQYTDLLSLYLLVPLAFFGTIFNLMSFGIFCKKAFNQIALFKYMRVYTFSSFIISFSLVFFFFFAPFTFYELSISYISRVYICKITQSYVTMLFFFYQNSVNILINIERALNFSNGFVRFKKVSPYLLCFIAFLLCVLIHGPNFLLYNIVSDHDLYIKFRYCEKTAFTESSLGKLLLIISYVLQGPFVLTGEIVTNIISMVSFIRFMRRKAELNARRFSANESIVEKRKRKKNEKINRKLLFMNFYFGIFSILIHIIQISSQFVIFLFNLSPSVSTWFVFVYPFVICLKNFPNIFFYYKFNKQFKNCFLLSYKASPESNQYTPAYRS